MATANVPPALAAVMLRDRDIAQCVAESGKSAGAYLSRAFSLHAVTLRGGEQMTVAIGADPCLAVGQSVRIVIYQRIASGYRRVLNAVTLPDFAVVGADGTATLPTHETMDVMMESAYVWNGSAYVFSPVRSHRYDVGLQQRRPYERPVRFAPGTTATTLTGSVAYDFGDRYAFAARAGQRVTIEIVEHGNPPPYVALWHDDDLEPVAEGISGTWSGRLRAGGNFYLTLSGSDERNEERLQSYTVRLSIR